MTPVHWQTAGELAAAVRSGELSAREVVRSHLDQVEQLNPHVNAIVTLVAEQAMEQARAADDQLASGAEVGPLHGIPIAHKDTHATSGIRTTSGSPILRDRTPKRDELIVERLRAAGAITIGKTNVPEFSAGAHTFNPLFGPTRNPYDLTRTPGGSSGGAAAALAAGMHPLADGSDMGGSLRFPAAFCNVVGFRPSPGRVPIRAKYGWDRLTVHGPMARSVSDVALAMSVIAGPDQRCPQSLNDPGEQFAVPLQSDVRGLRVAVSPDFGGELAVEPEAAELVQRQAAVFEELGCQVDDTCPDFTGADEAFQVLRSWSLEMTLGELFDKHREHVKSSLARNIEHGRRLSGPDIGRAAMLHTKLFHTMQAFFEHYDVLALPVSQVAPFDLAQEFPQRITGIPQESYLDWMRSCSWVSVTGLPALSVPAGFTESGLPMGVQLVGPPQRDLDLLRIGYAFEQASGHGQRRARLVTDRETPVPA
ncbi:MAG: amidase [Saccharopolyspora sp.]|uniref:amidase n=1 Tax=Saccharopolyspora TaxID=1835 RepID=UPI00190AC039|nr:MULTISPECIES: amidase [unclassified Saccharopolyspora]MBK0869456.1 amidase [Saccharopolyspora sp. HNM0986]MBQ6642214.1 amidase [Saccharopolyspora sp.]